MSETLDRCPKNLEGLEYMWTSLGKPLRHRKVQQIGVTHQRCLVGEHRK